MRACEPLSSSHLLPLQNDTLSPRASHHRRCHSTRPTPHTPRAAPHYALTTKAVRFVRAAAASFNPVGASARAATARAEAEADALATAASRYLAPICAGELLRGADGVRCR